MGVLFRGNLMRILNIRKEEILREVLLDLFLVRMRIDGSISTLLSLILMRNSTRLIHQRAITIWLNRDGSFRDNIEISCRLKLRIWKSFQLSTLQEVLVNQLLA